MIKAMKSLKRDKDKVIMDSFPVSAMEQNDYPYGTRLCLCQEELEKLECDIDDFKDGSLIHIFGMARVVVVRKETINGKERNEVTLQIEDMSIECEDAEKAPEPQKEPLSKRRAKLYDRGHEDKEEAETE